MLRAASMRGGATNKATKWVFGHFTLPMRERTNHSLPSCCCLVVASNCYNPRLGSKFGKCLGAHCIVHGKHGKRCFPHLSKRPSCVGVLHIWNNCLRSVKYLRKGKIFNRRIRTNTTCQCLRIAMSNTPASRSPRQSIIDRTRHMLTGLLRREAELRGGPRPTVHNTDGHTYRVALCMGKSQDFYAIGKWYKIVSFLLRLRDLMCLTFIFSALILLIGSGT